MILKSIKHIIIKYKRIYRLFLLNKLSKINVLGTNLKSYYLNLEAFTKRKPQINPYIFLIFIVSMLLAWLSLFFLSKELDDLAITARTFSKLVLFLYCGIIGYLDYIFIQEDRKVYGDIPDYTKMIFHVHIKNTIRCSGAVVAAAGLTYVWGEYKVAQQKWQHQLDLKDQQLDLKDQQLVLKDQENLKLKADLVIKDDKLKELEKFKKDMNKRTY